MFNTSSDAKKFTSLINLRCSDGFTTSRSIEDTNDSKTRNFHYHSKLDRIYGDRTLKLCRSCLLTRYQDIHQSVRHIDLIILSKNSTQTNNYFVNKDKKICINDVRDSEVYALDLTFTVDKNRPLSVLPLTEIPVEVFQFNYLYRLHLDGNQIETIPDELGNTLWNLRILTCSSNMLITLPKTLKNLRYLESLHLSHNKFEKIPEVVYTFKKLRFLDFSSNFLSEIPNCIDNFAELQSLLLLDNKLRDLPETIGNLKSLKTLWLGSNMLWRLPRQICEMESLQWNNTEYNLSSDLAGNPLEEPPMSICIKGMMEIKEYFNQE